jgi:CRP-like cAMP-binding protein
MGEVWVCILWSHDYFGELSVDGLMAAEVIAAASQRRLLILNLRRLILVTCWRRGDDFTVGRVRSVSAQRTLLGLPNPFQRLCVQIMQLSRAAQNDRHLLDPVPTHQELAIMINASRETVTRAFQVLTLHQAIHREGAQLRILRPDFLNDVGEGRIDPPKA